MPDKKIVATFVLCLGVITSIWLIQKTQTNISYKNNSDASLSNINSKDEVSTNTNDDWKKMLVGLSQKNQTVSDISQNNTPEDTTLTSALAIDVFSKYLLIANKSGGITTDDASNISNDVLSSFGYNNTGKVTYTLNNLKIIKAKDSVTVRNYYDSIHEKFTNRTLETKEDPVTILNKALQTESVSYLSRLNPFISTYKGVISDLLDIEVPSDAIQIHLNLLNAYSSVLSDLESFRAAISDPIRGIFGISQYEQDKTNLQTALININDYFENKLSK